MNNKEIYENSRVAVAKMDNFDRVIATEMDKFSRVVAAENGRIDKIIGVTPTKNREICINWWSHSCEKYGNLWKLAESQLKKVGKSMEIEEFAAANDGKMVNFERSRSCEITKKWQKFDGFATGKNKKNGQDLWIYSCE